MASGSAGLGDGFIKATGLKSIRDATGTPQAIKNFIDGLKSTLDSIIFVGAQVDAKGRNPCGDGETPLLLLAADVTEEIAQEAPQRRRRAQLRRPVPDDGDGDGGTTVKTCCKMDITTLSTFGARSGQIIFYVNVPPAALKAEGTLKIETDDEESTATYEQNCRPPLCGNDKLIVDVKYTVDVELKFTATASPAGAINEVLNFFGAGFTFKAGFEDVCKVDVTC